MVHLIPNAAYVVSNKWYGFDNKPIRYKDYDMVEGQFRFETMYDIKTEDVFISIDNIYNAHLIQVDLIDRS